MSQEVDRIEGLNLRDARMSAGLSIQELGTMTEIRYGTIQAIETGRTPGTLMAKIKLASALRRSFRELWPETYAEVGADIARGFKPPRKSGVAAPRRGNR